eukprot:3985983-Prymnesium_polylepis.1
MRLSSRTRQQFQCRLVAWPLGGVPPRCLQVHQRLAVCVRHDPAGRSGGGKREDEAIGAAWETRRIGSVAHFDGDEHPACLLRRVHEPCGEGDKVSDRDGLQEDGLVNAERRD